MQHVIITPYHVCVIRPYQMVKATWQFAFTTPHRESKRDRNYRLCCCRESGFVLLLFVVKNDAFLQLGRLDGRLANSLARAVWAVRMQLRAIAQASVAAGVPVSADDIEHWIAAGGDMPRRREGLNDPWRISTIAHFALAAQQTHRNPLAGLTHSLIDPLFDHREVALETAPHEVLELTPIWRETQRTALVGGLPNIATLADRLATLVDVTDADLGQTLTVADPFDRDIHFVPGRSASWLAAIAVPVAVNRLGLTATLMPNLVPPPRLFHVRRGSDDAMIRFWVGEAKVGSAELDRLERCLAGRGQLARTARSRVDRAALFRLAFPSITGMQLAKALGATPQGGSYLLRQLSAA